MLLVIADDAHIDGLFQAFAQAPFQRVDLARGDVDVVILVIELIAVQQRESPGFLRIEEQRSSQGEHVAPKTGPLAGRIVAVKIPGGRPYGITEGDVVAVPIPGQQQRFHLNVAQTKGAELLAFNLQIAIAKGDNHIGPVSRPENFPGAHPN